MKMCIAARADADGGIALADINEEDDDVDLVDTTGGSGRYN